VKVDFSEFEYGFQYKRIRTDTDETDRLWQIGRVCLWPNALFTGNHIEFRVPIDDENMLSVTWHFSRVPKDREPYVQKDEYIPTWHAPIKDKDGNWITSHVMNQDFLAWVGQGTIADRSLEYLATSDRGIVLIRNQFLRDMEAIDKGKDPKAVVRDPGVNKRIMLPVAERKPLMEGKSIAELLRDPDQAARIGDYIFQAGQPKEVRDQYLAAMGVNDSDVRPPDETVDILAPPEKRIARS
jgi:5,5'-dehydrodivanillate O-demethylase